MSESGKVTVSLTPDEARALEALDRLLTRERPQDPEEPEEGLE